MKSILSSRFPRCLLVICLIFSSLCLEVRASLFTVINTADSGPGSLREAMTNSNGVLGPNTITFNISGGSPVTIAPLSPLPALVTPVTIDATTQPGFSGVPVVELNGANAGAGVAGLRLRGGSSTVRGLVINRFAGRGIWIDQHGGNVIEGNYVGTDVTGLTGMGNGLDGILIENGTGVGNDAGNNRIGGVGAAARNVICDNRQAGIWVTGGAGNNAMLNNYVGIDAVGLHALGNFYAGLIIETGSNVIGGMTAAERNVVSGNRWSGVYLYRSTATGNAILGNYLGTDATGLVAVANRDRGIAILDGIGNTVGGASSGARNVVSGNLQGGVLIDGVAASNVVRGNYIGTNSAGMAALGNGLNGLDIRSAHENTVGGSAAGEGNLISGNQQSGIFISAFAYGNTVQGNRIGTKINGTALGNPQYGVFVFDGAENNLIGGPAVAQGNVIAFNCAANDNFDGVRVHFSAGQGNRVSSNSIPTNNGALGIDVGINGVTANDAGDLDGFQNEPLLICAAISGARMLVFGTLSSTANQTFTVELFSNFPPGTIGLGERPNGTTAVATGPSGTGAFSIVCPVINLAGSYISATATNASNSTSEFSPTSVASALDSDGDGIADVLETAFQMNPNNSADAALDADGDGRSNGLEILAGTNPADARSVLRISAVQRSVAGATVSFPSISGVRYRLEMSTNLYPPWVPLNGEILGTGSAVSVIDLAGASAGVRFYRITVIP